MQHSVIPTELLAHTGGDALYRTLVEMSPDGIVLTSLDGVILTVNSEGARMMGFTCREAAVGRSVFSVVSEADRGRAVEAMRQRASLEAPLGRNVEYRLLRDDGSTLPIEVNSSVVLNEDREPTGVLIMARDISERKRTEQELRESEESFRIIFAGNPQPMWVYDAESLLILEANASASLYYGYSHDDFLHMRVTDLDPVPGSGNKELVYRGQSQHRLQDGRLIDVEITSHLVKFAGKTAVLMMAQDITERKREGERLKQIALHDALTGLPNRVLFEDRLRQAIRRGHREGMPVALLYIDLDGFKDVNDTLGHQAGDALLRQLAGRLAASLRESDTVARLGGDEFGIVLPEVGVDGAVAAAEKVLSSLAEPFQLNDQWRCVGASIGIAVYPDHARAFATLVRHADSAMYTAKRDRIGFLVHGSRSERVIR